MILRTYESVSRLWRSRPHRCSLGGLALGILLVCSFSSGCSSRPRPLSLAFTGMTFAPDQQGFSELLSKLHGMNADERKSQVRSFADSSAAPELKQKAAYILAQDLRASASADDQKEAVARYRQAAALAPLSERCLWHISECAGTAGQEKAAREALAQLIEHSKDKEARAKAVYTLGQSYMRTGEHALARTTLSQLFSMAPDSQYALGATYYLAELDLAKAQPPAPTNGSPEPASGSAAGQPEPEPDPEAVTRALAAFRHYLQQSPDGHFARGIADQLKSMPEFQATAADHNLLARTYFADGSYKTALDEWHQAGDTVEWYKQGVSLLRLGRTAEGKSLLTAGMAAHPSEESVPTAATALCRMVNRDGAIAIWKGVLQRSPKFADAALYNLAIRAPSEPVALDYYRRLVGSYPTSAFAPESAWWLAWNAVKAGKSHDALAMLQVAANRYPEAKAAPRFIYWTGKMHERLGQKDAAKKAYARAAAKAPWHYYAHRALQRLAALNGSSDPGWRTNGQRQVHWTQDTAQEWQFPEPPAELAAQEGATIALLTELQQWDECLELLPEEGGLLKSFYLAKLDMPLEAINAAGKALHGKPQPGEQWQLAYPLLYARFISSEAPAKHVDPLLVQALIREESRYNAQAISSSRALGLMQLMPATAYGVAKRLGIPLSGTADIHKPENNLRMGIDYLSYVLKRFNGNALFAVASYNGGPNAVQSWAKRMPGDTDVFVENIPFKETRDYVRKVFGSYWNYQAVYAPPPAARSH